jgi:hypothetical protein
MCILSTYLLNLLKSWLNFKWFDIQKWKTDASLDNLINRKLNPIIHALEKNDEKNSCSA